MQSERERRIEQLFQELAALPALQRDSYLQEHCADDEILHRVRLLLRHDDLAGSAFLRGISGDAASAAGSVSQQIATHPQQIGRFRILSVLGHGGMGTVYEAEHDKPHRKVALKVIRPGWMSPAMLRRFEYEAEVLARLDHPGIARVFDAGTADTGHGPQPYFAMELVRGKRLDQYIREKSPPRKQRLELLIEICQAVHHAHTKGVIHRDLKPANILITDEGKPKILDFGVARATDSDIQSTTLHTESGQLVGTLPYMAPEQAAGRAHELDTSSDVYALGVIAFELLSGKLPYALADKPLHEAVRVICEDEPSRLSSIDRSLRGDVETIVGKALEKDKTRRYHTAGELAADVKRYLDYEPITARPPGTWYQVAKFARRNKFVVSGVVTVLVILCGATIVSTLQAVRATRAERRAIDEKLRADEQAAIAKAVNQFFNNDVLGQASPKNQSTPQNNPNRDLTVRQALDRAAQRLSDEFQQRPLIKAAIHGSIGEAYEDVGEMTSSNQHLLESLRLLRQHAGAHAPETLAAQQRLALLYNHMGRFDESEQLFKDALEVQQRTLGEDHENTLSTMVELGGLYQELDRYSEAEPLLTRSTDAHRRIFGDLDVRTLFSVQALGTMYFHQGNYEKARSLFLEALKGMQQVLGEQHPDTLAAVANVGTFFTQIGEFDQAEGYLLAALQSRRTVHGEEHPDVISSMSGLGIFYVSKAQHGSGDMTENLAKGESLLTTALKSAPRILGSDHPETLLLRQRLAMVYIGQERYGEAKPLLVEALEIQRRTLGNQHQATLNTMNDLAGILEREGELTEAEAMYLQSWQGKRVVRGVNHQSTLTTLYNLCDLYVESKAYAKAEPLILEGLQAASTNFEKDDQRVRGFQRLLGVLYYRQKKYAQAEPIFSLLVHQISQTDVNPEDITGYLRFYGMTLYKLARHEEALRPLSNAYERLKPRPPAWFPARRELAAALADACDNTNRPDEAAKWRAELAALQAATQPATQAVTVHP